MKRELIPEKNPLDDLPVWRMAPLRASSYPARNEHVVCVLYRIGYRKRRLFRIHRKVAMAAPPLYVIGMETLKDKNLCVVGENVCQAIQLFERIVRMTVTPCTLQDVVADFMEES